jgi:Protein of unknown function, DUF481
MPGLFVEPTSGKGSVGRYTTGGRSVCNLLLCLLVSTWVCQARAETFDTITFSDGEQLKGKLVSILAGSVTFHSEVLGNVTVPLTKVTALNTTHPFAMVEKDQRFTKASALAKIPVGSISLGDRSFRVNLPKPDEKSFPATRVGSVIDASTFHQEIHGESDFLYGWAGSITLGASLAYATNSAQTYTGSVALARAIPTIAWLPPMSKTTLNLSGTYGLAENPQIVSRGQIYQSSSISKTNILHGDTEYDRYLSPAIFGLVNATADHNFGNGLRLQQAYGAGLGWNLINRPRDNFALKAALQYQQQEFYNGLISGLGTPSVNLIGAAFNESWTRAFAHSIKFNEYVTVTPTFNVTQAYSAVGSTSFVFPVYKKLNFTVSSTDNYLGDPPQGFRRNSFQFTTGITYVLK